MQKGFTELNGGKHDMKGHLFYATAENLTGKPLAGYLANKMIGTWELKEALEQAAAYASEKGFALFIFDAYRPQKAVDNLVMWAKEKEENKALKAKYYPNEKKEELVLKEYIASRSGHSRGSVADLTLVDIIRGHPLDMGTIFDFMDESSRHGSPSIGRDAAQNRLLLRNIMEKSGFLAYEKEWWHYRLAREPFKDTYFDFDIV